VDSVTRDDSTGRGRIQAARVRQAGVDAGIGPDSALAPFVEALAAATEKIADIPAEVSRRMAEVKRPEATFTAEDVVRLTKAVTANAARELPHAIDRMATQRYWRYGLIGGVLIAAALVATGAGGYWRGSRTEAERYANLPAELNVAMSNHDAARWLDMMRKNTQPGALDRCTSVDTTATGGRACSFVLWTEPPGAAPR
jgi:hypothetical protein